MVALASSVTIIPHHIAMHARLAFALEWLARLLMR